MARVTKTGRLSMVHIWGEQVTGAKTKTQIDAADIRKTYKAGCLRRDRELAVETGDGNPDPKSKLTRTRRGINHISQVRMRVLDQKTSSVEKAAMGKLTIPYEGRQSSYQGHPQSWGRRWNRKRWEVSESRTTGGDAKVDGD